MTDRQRAFLVRHPHYAMRAICLYYPLSIELLRKHKTVLNWEFIRANRSIHWSTEIIDEFLEYLLEDGRFDYEFSNNPALPWSVEFVKRYNPYWDWTGVVQNEILLKQPEIIEAFKLQTKQETPSTSNGDLIDADGYLDLNYIRLNRHTIDWSHLSAVGGNVTWDITFMEEFESLIDFGVLYHNRQAWTTPFGDLAFMDINGLLENELITLEKEAYVGNADDPTALSHIEIPKSLGEHFKLE